MPSPTLYEQIQEKSEHVHQHGRYFSCLCPFPDHADRNPSMLVYQDGFYCCGCRRKGPLTKLWKVVSSKDPSSVRVSRDAPITPHLVFDINSDPELFALRAHDILMAFEDQQLYLVQRKVEDRIEPNFLGWIGGYYTIPIYSAHNSFQGVVLRAGPELEKRQEVRYVIPQGQAPYMFVPDWSLFNRSNHIYVVFGMFDALVLSSLRVPVCTSTHGHRFNPDWLYNQRKRISVIPDKNDVEYAAARELAQHLDWRGHVLKLEYPEGTKDPAEIVEKGKAQWLLSQL